MLTIDDIKDCIPVGWYKAFGKILERELKEATANDPEFEIYDIKEKFGELRIYHNGDRRVDEIVDAFTVISQYTCVDCGKLGVGSTKRGWVFPCCRECYKNGDYDKDCTPYEPIPKMRKVSCYSKEGFKTVEYDISKYVDEVYERAKKNIMINNIKDYEPNDGYEEDEDSSDEIYGD